MNSIETALNIRRIALEMVHRSKGSHIGSALGIADILAVLYTDVLNLNAYEPNWQERDRFILSKGHACSALYAALALKNYLELDDLHAYGKNGSTLMNHASHKVNGVEFSTGSLGHGLPFAVGKAIFAKRKQLGFQTYVLISDGELNEGSNWEAIMFASHHQLSNLTCILDYNRLQSLTTTAETLNLEPVFDKAKSFGWDVIDIDGHNHHELQNAFLLKCERPKFIICNTVKGKGVSFMENQVAWHYKNPDDSELGQAIKELNGA